MEKTVAAVGGLGGEGNVLAIGEELVGPLADAVGIAVAALGEGRLGLVERGDEVEGRFHAFPVERSGEEFLPAFAPCLLVGRINAGAGRFAGGRGALAIAAHRRRSGEHGERRGHHEGQRRPAVPRYVG